MVELSDSVKHIRDNVHTILGRNNDFIVKVINGKTEERLASELIGEMYVQMKVINGQTTVAASKKLKNLIKDYGSFLSLVLLLLTLIKLWSK
ncbi:MAG: hypothetical protein COW85_05725 [Ignavibacteria bacterium CG22_combo_CG10-13_8_21_14_all_37_15]|nr:MAG: hypothetical protein COW85_05725 [Ignavibacteria bacterium CG22_combo_CG10-13_8_21_14_all_37_15]